MFFFVLLTDIFTSSRHRRDTVNIYDNDAPKSHSKVSSINRLCNW